MSSPDVPDEPVTTESASCPDPIETERDSELWFADGNLVLQAQRKLFRVYGGLLAVSSPIFDDMLKLPQPDDGETLDGCPLVILQDDPRDLKYFLKALFDYRFFLPIPRISDFNTISGVLRLSKKYEVDPLRIRALEHLSSAFPTALESYPGVPSWAVKKKDLMRIIVLGRQFSIDWILPFACYRFCQTDALEAILNGMKVGAEHIELSPSDKLLFLRQYTALRLAGNTDICDFLWNPTKISGCVRPQRCMESRISVRQTAEHWRVQDMLPLELWIDWTDLEVCETCMKTMKRDHQTARQAFWDGLPERFGLPAWDELIKIKDKSLGVKTTGEALSG